MIHKGVVAKDAPVGLAKSGTGSSQSARFKIAGAKATIMNAAAWNIPGVVLLTVTLSILTTADAEAQGLGLFRVEGQAQQHCPNDAVVWLDLKKRTYYLQGQRLYGRGRTAVFACRNEARRSGNRRSLLGWR